MFFEKLIGNLGSADWWASEFPSYVIFTLIVGFMISLVGRRIEHRRFQQEREPFEGWKLKIIGYGDPDQNLYFEDVRRFLNSDFEIFRFLKSVCTTICDLRTKTLADAKDTWFFVDPSSRTMTVDFTRIPDGQVDRWKRELPPERQQRSA
jgi:hypothetical protein